jgi:capsular exopolysaccharide synthesis family protein
MSIDDSSGLRFSDSKNPASAANAQPPSPEGIPPSPEFKAGAAGGAPRRNANMMMIEDGPVLREVMAQRGYEGISRDSLSQGGGDELLYLRRAAQVVLQHWVIALLILLITPASVFVIDTYYREHRFVSRIRCQYNDTSPVQNMPLIGPMADVRISTDILNPSQVVRRPEVQQRLAESIHAYASRLQSVARGETEGELKPGEHEIYPLLLRMVDDEGRPTGEFGNLLGNISARNISDYEAEFALRSPHRSLQPVLLQLLVQSVNDVVRERQRNTVEEMINSLQQLWEKSNRQLDETRKKILSLNDEMEEEDVVISANVNEYAQLEEKKYQTEIQLTELQWRLRRLERDFNWEQLKERYRIKEISDINQVFISSHPMRERLRELELQRDELSERVTAAHPKMKSVMQRIASVRETLKKDGNVTAAGEVPPLPSPVDAKALEEIQKLRQEIELVELRLREIQKRIPKEKPKPDTPEKSVDPDSARKAQALLIRREELMSRLRTHQSFARRIYDHLSQARLISDQLTHEHAYVPLGTPTPVLESPRLVVDIPLALVLGLIIGCAAAFLSETIYNHPRTPFDLYYHFRLNYLGLVPFWPKDASFTIDAEQPDSHIAEIYAHLRNNVRYSGGNEPQRCLLVGSATQGEGKSVVSVNLAISYALEGNNVLLIDADLRRPRSHVLLDGSEQAESAAGLAEYLDGSTTLDAVITPTHVQGLSMVPGRGRVKNPAKLIGSERMRQLLAWGQENYDAVIVDCPAILPVVDATYLAPLVRGVLMVVAAEEVEIPEVRMALYRLQHVGNPPVGAVLNKVRGGLSSYYYGYRYGAASYHNNPAYSEVYRTDAP